jgi:hypothetical protein
MPIRNKKFGVENEKSGVENSWFGVDYFSFGRFSIPGPGLLYHLGCTISKLVLVVIGISILLTYT